jgi:hypothetical protein
LFVLKLQSKKKTNNWPFGLAKNWAAASLAAKRAARFVLFTLGNLFFSFLTR